MPIGMDNISCRHLKEAAPIIAPIITKIVNSSFDKGIFPSPWKRNKVIPLHKANDRSDPNNYRPISILPILSKICERAAYDQLFGYLNESFN